MATLSKEFKKKVAELYSKKKHSLDQLDPNALEQFASEALKAIQKEKENTPSSHDIEVLEQAMKHLKQDSTKLKNLQPDTDDYDFTRNDCKNLLNSTRRWLKTEELI
ncbi:MAG TPA: hypothetical protein VJ249_09420 [Candidatus Bathyarchaeia archaeon]|nr:hypothetical protein [Candidatus Bathyarchaeia archaeon]